MKPKIFFIILAGVAAVAGCKPKSNSHAHQPPPPAVTVAPVEQRELVEYDEFTGRVEAVESVEVRPRVSGHIQEVRFQAGQLVKQGDPLFVIDPRWHQAEAKRTEGEAARARAHFENAEHEWQRAAQLLDTRAISVEEADGRKSKFTEAHAALLAAEAAHESAKLDLEFTEVRAPIPGRVSRALVTAGNFVSGIPGANTMLTTIVSVDPVYVYSDVDEANWLKLQRLARGKSFVSGGDRQVTVEMALQDEEGFPHRGVVESFDNRLDANTGSILLRTVFANPDGKLVPGLFARVRVPGSEPRPALLISERAIGTDQSQKFVLTLSPTNTVEYRPVKIGPAHEGQRVIRDGLRPGDQVVVNGLARVRPGMSVTPETQTASANGDFKFAKR